MFSSTSNNLLLVKLLKKYENMQLMRIYQDKHPEDAKPKEELLQNKYYLERIMKSKKQY